MARPSIQSNLRSFRSIRCTRSYSLISSKSLAVQDYPAPHTGVIRVLSLNKFETRNAISRNLLKDLRSEVVKIEGQSRDSCTPVRAAIIASALDNCFCAGADLKERLGFTRAEYVAHISRARDTILLRFRSLMGSCIITGARLFSTHSVPPFGLLKIFLYPRLQQSLRWH